MSIRLATILRVVSKLRLATTSLAEQVKDFVEDGLYNKDPDVVLEALKRPRVDKNRWPVSPMDLLLKANPSLYKNKEFITEVVKLGDARYNKGLMDAVSFLLLHVKDDYPIQLQLALTVPNVISALPSLSKDMLLALIKQAVNNHDLTEGIRNALNLPELFQFFAPYKTKLDPDFEQLIKSLYPTNYRNYLK
jgi:hypothetical protein